MSYDPRHEMGIPESAWVALCERYGQDPDDPDAFCVTPPNRLRRMLAEALAQNDERPAD